MHAVELFKNVMLRYGVDWVLWFLVGLSALIVGVALERWLYYRRRSGNTQALAEALEKHLRSHDPAATPAWPDGGRALAARVVDAGVAVLNDGAEAATQAMQSRAALEHDRLERRLSILGTIGNNAPFVGLLGTVIGVVHAFDELSRASAAGQQQSATVMSGIAEALVATAVGLMVAIPAVAIYNTFHRRMTSLTASTEVLTRLLLAHIAIREGASAESPKGGGGKSAEGRDSKHPRVRAAEEVA